MTAIKIAYILSVGHSGSSLLDVLLGHDKQAVSIGEVKLDTNGHIANMRCTCDHTIQECEFWNEIDRRIRDSGTSLFNITFAGDTEDIHTDDIYSFYRSICDVSGAKLIVDSSKSISRLRALEKAGSTFDLRVIFLERIPFGVVASNYRKGRNWIRHTFMYLINNASRRQFAASYNPLHINYDEIVSDPKATIERIYRFL
ncbi:MAG: sulfotransferase, partial [bacterium]